MEIEAEIIDKSTIRIYCKHSIVMKTGEYKGKEAFIAGKEYNAKVKTKNKVYEAIDENGTDHTLTNDSFEEKGQIYPKFFSYYFDIYGFSIEQ